MLSGRKVALTLVFTGLVALATGVSCRGFFVSPTLSTISVSPSSQTIETGSTDNTQQFTATGTYSDGSTGNPPVSWTSSEPGFATVSASGLATAVSIGQTSITATSVQNGTITGSAALTVSVGCIESITLSQVGTQTVPLNDGTYSITASATTCTGPVDVTDIALWTSTNTSVATITDGTATLVAAGTTGITASVGAITSPTTTLNVTD
ncbi:MAG: Ig-like domain-containing protein [Terriglobales bacterium]